MGSEQRRHDLLCKLVRGTRIRTKEGERLISIVSCTWPGSRCSTMGLHRSRDTHKNTRSSRSTCARLLSDIGYKWGQIVMNAHLFPLVDHLLKRVYCIVYSFGESREISGNFSLFFIGTLSVFLAPSDPKLLNKGVVGVCRGCRHQLPLHRKSERGRILFTRHR